MTPGLLEVIITLGGAAFGGGLTLLSNLQKDRAAKEAREAAQRDQAIAAASGAREFAAATVEGERRVHHYRAYRLGPWPLFSREKVIDEEGILRRESGFHFTRRLIALIVVGCGLAAPVLLPLWVDNLSIAYGYPAEIKGFLGFGGASTIDWLIIGDGERTLFIPPYVSYSLSAIIGLFFGNQFLKR